MRKAHNFINLKGKRFGRLTILRDSGRQNSWGNPIWICFCLCGNFKEIVSANLLSGRTKSCGCIRKERTKKMGDKYGGKIIHGESQPKTRLYRIWAAIKSRCLNSRDSAYYYYGGRGIKVCNEWKDNYLAFKKWALANGYRDNLTIDRIDNDGDYESSNCQWITQSENIKKYWEKKKNEDFQIV